MFSCLDLICLNGHLGLQSSSTHTVVPVNNVSLKLGTFGLVQFRVLPKLAASIDCSDVANPEGNNA